MKLRELSLLTGEPERQIRYMLAEGFVPPPEGGRATADYGESHVAAIRRYSVLRQHGLPPQAIKVLLAGGLSAPFAVAPGIALHVDPELVGQAVDVDALLVRIRDVVSDVFKEHLHDPRKPAARERSRK